MESWFDTAHGYAVFPSVGKGGIGIGGAHGKGLVIKGGKTVANTSLSQLTIGFQLGGQVYSQYIFFKDNERDFQDVFNLYARLMTIPASSADLERSFSVAGGINCKRTNRMREEVTISRTMLKSNIAFTSLSMYARRKFSKYSSCGFSISNLSKSLYISIKLFL